MAGSRRRNIGTTYVESLTDILVHGQDIAIPLGRHHDVPPQAAAIAASRLLSMRWPPPLPASRQVAGFRLTATDISWSAGEGPEVKAPMAAILLVCAGRLAALPQLSGEGARGVDIVLDCTSGAGVAPVLLGIDALKRREGTLLIQGELAAFPDFPVKKVTEKAITIRSARGHSFRACELAVRQLASGRYPLGELATHRFGLSQVDRAIRAVGGEAGEDVVHVSLMPWEE